MALAVDHVRFGPDEECSGILAFPARARPPLPGVVVIQEIFGIDAHIEDLTRRVAAAGYAALAPDVYAHGGERPGPLEGPRLEELKAFVEKVGMRAFHPDAREQALAEEPPELAARLRETIGLAAARVTDLDTTVRPVVAAARFLRDSLPLTRGQKIGSVGWCMGGGLSARLAAADPDLAAAVIFYGTSPPPELAARIRCPVLGFYAGNDDRINQTVPGLAAALAAGGVPFEQHVYPGTVHAFFNDTRSSYDVAAARDSFARTLRFLAGALA